MDGTYDPALPTEKDWVRCNVGDRGPTTFILDDDEIAAILLQERNKWMAAFRCGSIIIARGRGAVSKAVDGLSISWGDSPESGFRKHLQTLREEGCRIQLPQDRVFEIL